MRVRGALWLVLVAVCGGCDAKKPAEERSDAADPDTGPRAHELVVALPGCHPAVAGGSVLSGITPGSLSIAASNGKALVVSSSTQSEEAVVLGPTGAAASPVEVITSAQGGDGGADSPRTFASALSLGSELSTLTYASGRRPSASCADAVLSVRSAAQGAARRELLSHACRPAETLRAAGRGKLGIALATSGAARPVEAWIIDGAETKPVVLETLGPATVTDGGPPTAPSLDVPALAAGSSSVAAAYVVRRGTGARELHAVRLGGHGSPPARMEILDKENVRDVTLAFEDDTLHVVWSVLVPEKKRFVLRWSKWPAGGAPSAPQTIGTGVLSATSPSLAVDHGRFVLAWAEGDEKATTIKVGASRLGLAPIPGLATVVSTAGAAAGGPAVAIDGDAMFVAWVERSGQAAAVRASALSCLE
jgi:hypothetical protein